MLSSNALFGATCFIAVCLAVVVPAFAAWGTPASCAILCGLLITSMPLILRGHQWSILLSGTSYVVAACAVGYLVFGPVIDSGAWEPGKIDFIVFGLGFAFWIAGIVTATLCYPLTSIPLTLQLTLPAVAFFLFQVGNFTRPRIQTRQENPKTLELGTPIKASDLALRKVNNWRPELLQPRPVHTPSKANTFLHLGTE